MNTPGVTISNFMEYSICHKRVKESKLNLTPQYFTFIRPIDKDDKSNPAKISKENKADSREIILGTIN